MSRRIDVRETSKRQLWAIPPAPASGMTRDRPAESEPSSNEQQYFRRLELENPLERAWEREMAREAEERRRFRELHKARCPSCAECLEVVRVRESEARQCPKCRGVWLERELFDALTREERSPLAELFRSQIPQHSLGAFHEAEERLRERERGG